MLSENDASQYENDILARTEQWRGGRCRMLLEFDADQRLWQETVRDAVDKQCPPSLVRSIAEGKHDGAEPLWRSYLEAGWTELTDPDNAVELAIVLEQLGRATDPIPFLATLSQFALLVGDRFDPHTA